MKIFQDPLFYNFSKMYKNTLSLRTAITFCISHFADILSVFLRYTPQNTKHSLYTFHISFKFYVSFKKSFDFSCECRPWHEMWNAKKEKRNVKKMMRNTLLYIFHVFHFVNVFAYFMKPFIHLSFIVFRHVRALFCELFCEIANQSLYTFHNIDDFVHLWFCEKVDEKLDECTNSSMKNRLSSELIRTSLKICKKFYRKI